MVAKGGMPGIEDAVKERFLRDFRRWCREAGRLEIAGPTCGDDRFLLSDSFFSTSGLWFLVEAKSYYGSLKNEDRKEAACQMCAAYVQSNLFRELHRRAHFACWSSTVGAINVELGVYGELICNRYFLPSCEICSAIEHSEPVSVSGSRFLDMLVGRRRELASSIGLEPTAFINYVRMLLEITKTGHQREAPFPLTLYGTSDTWSADKTFSSYEDFSNWYEEVAKLAPPGTFPSDSQEDEPEANRPRFRP